MTRRRKVRIVRHATLDEALEVFFGGPIPKRGSWEWWDADGEEHRQSFKRSYNVLLHQGFWGYCDEKQNIHIWLEEHVPLVEVVRLVAHELGHTMRPYHRTLKEEQKAGRYALVAKDAYQIACDLMGRNL